jgi:hypothetical protein
MTYLNMVSIPERVLGVLEQVVESFLNILESVSIPERVLGVLEPREAGMLMIFSFQGAFAQNRNIVTSYQPIHKSLATNN